MARRAGTCKPIALRMALAAMAASLLDFPATANAPVSGAPQLPALSELEFGRLLVAQRCANCHATTEGEDSFAAPLHHLFGRRAGSLEGYTFSINMKKLGIAWTPSTLNDWLRQTTFDTPDIRMRHVGVPQTDQRAAILEFLKSLPGNAPLGEK